MSFDGMFTHALIKELNTTFAGGRIHKIQQPYEMELVLTIRANRKNHKLLISAHPSFGRIQVTEQAYNNPETPPNFTMVLRKYVEGNIIDSIEQYDNDRIIIFNLTRRDELGDASQQQLIVEIMGRHSNIFLLDKDKKIIDAIKHVPMYQNTFRTILPGATYQLPPIQNQVNPFKVGENFEKDKSLMTAKFLQSQLMGLGRDSAIELASLIEKDSRKPYQVIQDFCADFENPNPTLVVQDDKQHFLVFPYTTISGEESHYDDLSALLTAYYAKKSKHDYVRQVGNAIIQVVEKNLTHQHKRLANLNQDMEKSSKADTFQLKGELLTTFLYQIEKGQTEVTLANYYDNDQPITISLDPALTPSQNAQKYYHKYNKLRNAINHIEKQKVVAEAEIQYLESIQTQLNFAEPNELADIRDELIDQGYLKKQKQDKKKRSNNASAKPREYKTVEGNRILVGRNNKQNDQLTMRQANKNHFWFHTKDIPGSHVILETDEPSEAEIIQAAELAAAFSKYSQSNNVPVDYTQVKHVKKPNGSKPGFVNYFEQKTIFVTPTKIV
ncbi:fibronectin-binding protein [Aerococcus urinaeequi]|uniref:Rqc2 homolog RqcH n=1 Tax=Aerococcus urinaeequi TaxID=51665 RepID=A0AAC8X1U7_9LACT|nr:NFACT RNA binding domain-containing protein [Aerococcus urinaeequi]ALZ87864.1 fibronectin-binding protein [Aerococcus urinaeequi]AMB98332.1 fibronectin-binding protein [Aerococcus urinaeequi]